MKNYIKYFGLFFLLIILNSCNSKTKKIDLSDDGWETYELIRLEKTLFKDDIKAPSVVAIGTLCILLLIFIVSNNFNKQPIYNPELLEKLNEKQYKFIAHAGGGIENIKYTNSLEAINQSIRLGFKIIEIDLFKE